MYQGAILCLGGGITTEIAFTRKGPLFLVEIPQNDGDLEGNDGRF